MRQFLLELCPFLELRILEIHSFPHFPLICFDILSRNFAYDLFYCTTDQVRISAICVKFCGSYAPFGTQNTENTQFSALFSYMLWHIELTFCIWLCFIVLQIKFECRQFASIFVRVMPLLELEYWKYTVFALFSNMLWHIELQFCIWLCLNVLQVKFECRQFASIFVGVMPLLELRILEIHSFPHFSLTCFDILSWNLHMTLFYCTSDQVRMFLICVKFCGSSAPFGS